MKRIALFLIPVLLLLMLCVSCSQNVSPELYYGMYSHLSEVWAQSLAHTDAKVAFFGDSRVIGADWNAAYPDSKVINLGVGGDKVSQLLDIAFLASGLLKGVALAKFVNRSVELL